jgi:hypothetical protein
MSNRWLEQVKEEIIDPERPIIDPHHHLWRDKKAADYELENLWTDTASGHNIIGTVFVECGAASWGASKKKTFANDRSNHVPSCGRVNSSKGSEGPSDFLRRSRDGRGLEYEIVRFCEYVKKYYAVKIKYGLSFRGNTTHPFKSCGITSI